MVNIKEQVLVQVDGLSTYATLMWMTQEDIHVVLLTHWVASIGLLPSRLKV